MQFTVLLLGALHSIYGAPTAARVPLETEHPTSFIPYRAPKDSFEPIRIRYTVKDEVDDEDKGRVYGERQSMVRGE